MNIFVANWNKCKMNLTYPSFNKTYMPRNISKIVRTWNKKKNIKSCHANSILQNIYTMFKLRYRIFSRLSSFERLTKTQVKLHRVSSKRNVYVIQTNNKYLSEPIFIFIILQQNGHKLLVCYLDTAM